MSFVARTSSALRRRDLFVTSSFRYRDARVGLLIGTAWEKARLTIRWHVKDAGESLVDSVFCSVTAAPAAAKLNVTKSGSVLKLGLDIHRDKFVVVAQYDHATPRPPQGFAPVEFVPWVEGRLREGFEVHVVYEWSSQKKWTR